MWPGSPAAGKYGNTNQIWILKLEIGQCLAMKVVVGRKLLFGANLRYFLSEKTFSRHCTVILSRNSHIISVKLGWTCEKQHFTTSWGKNTSAPLGKKQIFHFELLQTQFVPQITQRHLCKISTHLGMACLSKADRKY